MMQNKTCTILCEKAWSKEESETVAKRIKEDYSVHMWVTLATGKWKSILETLSPSWCIFIWLQANW